MAIVIINYNNVENHYDNNYNNRIIIIMRSTFSYYR